MQPKTIIHIARWCMVWIHITASFKCSFAGKMLKASFLPLNRLNTVIFKFRICIVQSKAKFAYFCFRNVQGGFAKAPF